MPTFNWTVTTTDYTLLNGIPDRIKTVHWRCTASEGEGSETAYGTVGVDIPASSSEAEVLAAAQAAEEGDDTLQAFVEAILTSRFIDRSQPEVASGRPWEFPADTPVWTADEQVGEGDVRLFDGIPYTVIQPHTTQIGWEPPNVPALWSIQGQDSGPQVWAPNEQVDVDTQRYYPTENDTLYTAIQAHTTQVGWEPPNAPALWAVGQ